ncbi:uncharacterized protein LOC129572142 [Sitodiplosis mosellana]|uniref:uncharacterized protein LOC129572142 n=1 Tax=Sitodiplosis mosellana TaxID=263140 RepID=UPI0024446009|nr:uncharacterized protein LOC129572142 [Sitodiplosis mosellana]
MNYFTHEFVEGHRRGSRLLWVPEEKYLYFKKDDRSGKTIYLCYENQLQNEQICSSRRSIDSEGTMTTNSIPHSCHSNHQAVHDKLKLRSHIIDSCEHAAHALEDLHFTIPTQQIFTREVAKQPLGATSLSYNSISRTLRRHVNKKYPSKPDTLAKIIAAYADPTTMLQYGFNLRDTHRFYVDTIDKKRGGFTIFASNEVMRMIDENIPPENRKYMLDGTFAVAPLGSFYQLLIIAIDYKKDLFPIVYVLMTDKEAASYQAVFEYIETHIFKLQPAEFMADFETGLRAAIQRYYPEASLHGCWYHYCSSIRRRLMTLDMHQVITDDPSGIEIHRMCLSLPLLPQACILEGFNVVQRTAREKGLYSEFKSFLNISMTFGCI